MNEGSETIPSPPLRRSGQSVRTLLLLGAVLAVTFLAYCGTLRFGFVHDDRAQILENPSVHSWRYLGQYFTAHVWAGIYPGEAGNLYRPLFLLWLRVNDVVSNNHAWAWHLTTILVHLGVTALVFFLARRILGDDVSAVVAALLFGVHPIHIEGVAWISGVTEPLLGFLLIASFLCYLKGTENPAKKRRWLAGSLALFGLAMLEKETALILPLLVAAYELVYAEGSAGSSAGRDRIHQLWRALRASAPYWAMVPLYMAARLHALGGFSHPLSLPLSGMLFTWPALIGFWTKHLLWPFGLSSFYDFPLILHPTLVNFTLPAVGVVAMGAGLVWGSSRSRPVAFASAWLVLPLLPLLDLRVLALDNFAQDRYLYLPSVGFVMIVTLLLRRISLAEAQLFNQPAVQVLAILFLAVTLGLGTFAQSFYFANNAVFYEYNAQRAPHNPIAQENLATLRAEQGHYGEAVGLLRKVLAEGPGDYHAWYNLGLAYYRWGDNVRAEACFVQAIRLEPGRPDPYFYLGMARFKQGRIPDAEAAIRRAIQLRPREFIDHFALGMALKVGGDYEGALEQFQIVLALKPDLSEAREQIRQIRSTLKRQGSDDTSKH